MGKHPHLKAIGKMKSPPFLAGFDECWSVIYRITSHAIAPPRGWVRATTGRGSSRPGLPERSAAHPWLASRALDRVAVKPITCSIT
jgi:hypothetical protein